jgi:Asp-tRNA(Asn)/Glu-tRNA(Gln) amidotransferase A subunit family amidase
MEGSVGMPVSVSIVAPPWMDETIVGIMKALDDKVNYHKELPHEFY